MSRIRHITLPAGFTTGAAHCGVKTTDQEDIAIIAADKPVATAMVTTTNQIIGAPVQWNRSLLPKGYGKTHGLVVNAGNSNVCNGKRGLRDAGTMAKLTAKQIGCDALSILCRQITDQEEQLGGLDTRYRIHTQFGYVAVNARCVRVGESLAGRDLYSVDHLSLSVA